MFALSALVLLAGCFGSDDADARAYATAMAPIFARNYDLGQQFLAVAGGIKQGTLDGPGVADTFGRVAVPLSAELATRAAAVTPVDPALADAHQVLVTAWNERAVAYRSAAEAWQRGDASGLANARAKIDGVHTQEQGYLEAVNRTTTPLGIAIELFPVSEVSP